MKPNNHVHTWSDGRGCRDVFFDGKILQGCVYADEQRGVVRVVRKKNGVILTDKWKKRVLVKTLHGRVEVVSKVQK